MTIVKTIDNVVKSCSYLKGTFNENAILSQKLAVALSGYSTEAVKSAIAQSTLNEEQIRAILIEKGLEGQMLETTTTELAQATATNALTASEGAATTATLGFKNALKGLGASIKALALAHPILTAIAAAGATVYGAVKAYDALTVSIEEQKEKMQESASAYEEAKNGLSNITTELETQEKELDDLISKDRDLTGEEQTRLETLQKTTKELRLHKDLAEKEEKRAKEEAAKDASDLYKKQFGRYEVSENAVKKYKADLKESLLSADQFVGNESDRNDISKMIAAYDHYNKLLNEDDGSRSDEEIKHWKQKLKEVKDNVFATVNELSAQRDSMADWYDTIKDTPYADLEEDNQEIVDSYTAIGNAIEFAYSRLEPAAWKQMQIDNVFDTEGIEKTKEELVEMSKAGELDESALQSYSKLSDALKENKLSASELLQELNALAQAELEAQGSLASDTSFSSRFQNLWDSDSFKDAKSDLAKLAKEAGIAEKDIQDLARENSELASLLNESGMSAQFAATCFNKVCNGAAGFSSITADALALDQVLHGMDESLQSVAASKSAYDKAMEQDDYNSDFENYQEAYKDAMQMFEDGDYGRHFRSAMEYFLGEDSYDMSIEELHNAMKNLKSVFGENATNGLEFLDKLYDKKDALDGLESSLEKLSDGSYDFDLKPEEFEAIGEALGMTADEVAACTNALGMFGNYHSYDLEELEETLNGISIAAKNGEQSILSMQGVEKILADIGYNGYEMHNILQDISEMDSIQILDFSAEDETAVQSVIDKLKELNMVEIGETSIDASGLVKSMSELGMVSEDICGFLEKLDGKFRFKDAEGSLISLNDAKNLVLQSEDESAVESVDKLGESAETTDGKVQKLQEDMEALNALNLGNLGSQFDGAGSKVDGMKQKVQELSRQIDEINSKPVAIPSSAAASGQGAQNSGNGTAKALGNAQTGHSFADGTIGAPKDETALINELGNETIIDPKSGTYEIVEGGAQFRKIKKGQIILNHLQTKALRKYGKISSFGRMLFGGNAKLKGSAYAGGTAGGTNPATGKPFRNSDSTSSKNAAKEAAEKAKEEKEKFEEVFDWIENRIDKFKRKFDKWLKQAETAVTSGFITKYYKKAASAAKNELSTYGKAYKRYMKEANAVGLDEKYAKKVRNGTIDIETIRTEGSAEDVKKYEELAEKIKKYQEYYEKAIDSTTSFVETAEKLYNLPLDKAATKIEKFKDSIDLLDKKLDNAIGFKKKNKLVDKQTKEEKKTLDAYKTAGTETKKNLKSAGKSLTKSSTLNGSDVSAKEKKAIKQAVKNGKEVNLSYFKEGSKAYNAAVKYNEALKKNKQAIYDAQVAQEEYNSWLVEASKIKFDNIADDYDKKIRMLDHQMTAIDNKVSEIETAGMKAHKSYYESQKKILAKEIKQYEKEKAALEQSLTGIKEGTDEWHDAYDRIRQIDSEISERTRSIYEKVNQINQLHFDLFDSISDSINRVITEQEFLQGLFTHEKNTDDKTGNFTEAGIAKLGSLSASYYAADNDAKRYAAEIKELRRMIESGSLESSLLGLKFNSIDDAEAHLKKLITEEQDTIKTRYDLQTKIYELMKEQHRAELNYLKELIDAKKEALSAEKSLHDYQKSINEKTKDINTVRKQIAAYSGDTSQEGMAKLQKLQKELSEKQSDLDEQMYDRYISDQQDMLDKLYEEYEELMTKKLDDFMDLFQKGLDKADANTALISGYLSKIAEKNEYDIETGGLFDSSSGGIGENVGNAVKDIDKDKTSMSGTQSSTGSNNTDNKPTEAKSFAVAEAKSSTTITDTVKDYISKHASKAKKNEKEYSAVNQAIYKNKAKAYKGTGKILSSKELKGLAENVFGIKYDNASKKGALYKKLKSIGFPGFKKGGVVSVDDIEKQVRENGDTGLVSVKNGEGILTPVQTEMFQKFIKNMDNYQPVVPLPNSLDNLRAISNARGMNNVVNIDMGGITMNGVNDPEEFSKQLARSVQTVPQARRIIQSVTTGMLAGGGNLSVNKIKC